MHSTCGSSCRSTSRRPAGSKRASCSNAAAPQSHGAMNTLRADLLHPGAAVAPAQLTLARAEPMPSLNALPIHVLESMHDGLRRPARPRRERDERGIVGESSARDGAPAAPSRRSPSSGVSTAGYANPPAPARREPPRTPPPRAHGGARPSRPPRASDPQARREIGRPQLLQARQHHRADMQRPDHREHPLRAAPEHRDDHITRPTPASASCRATAAEPSATSPNDSSVRPRSSRQTNARPAAAKNPRAARHHSRAPVCQAAPPPRRPRS